MDSTIYNTLYNFIFIFNSILQVFTQQTMPRPTKRVRASQKGGINSAAACKRRKLESSKAPELAKEEDKYPIGQPKVGWEQRRLSMAN